MQAPSILYRRRIKPKLPPVIPEGDYQSRERISIDSSDSSLRQAEHGNHQGRHVYAHSELSIPVTTRDIPNTQRSFSISGVSKSSRIRGPVTHSTEQQPQQSCAGPFSPNLMPCLNTWNTLENKMPRVPLENYGSVLDQGPVAAWNNVNRHSVESSRGFPNSHQHIEADSLLPWSSECERGHSGIAREGCEDSNSNTFPRSIHETHFAQVDEPLYRTRYGTNPARPDEYHSAGIYRPMQSSVKQPQGFDISNGLSALQVGNGENPQDMTGNDGMGNLGDSRPTTYTESTLSTDSVSSFSFSELSSNSISDDEGAYPGYNLNTGINLQRSYDKLSEGANVFQCDVHVWQNGLLPKPNIPDQLKFITLLFDTQCQGSNWVASKIVEELGAKVQRLSYQAEFIGFNGQPMTTFEKTTLWFKNSSGGSSWAADFLVSPVKKIPFDMLLGAADCLKFNIIEPPTLLGLAGPKQSKHDKEEEAARTAQHAKKAQEHERTLQKLKAARSKQNENGESSHGNKNKTSGSK